MDDLSKQTLVALISLRATAAGHLSNGAKRLRLERWGLAPGPLDFVEPFYSFEIYDDLAEYDAAAVAEATPRIPDVQLTHPAVPTWYDWQAQWTGEHGSHIELQMSLFDEPASFACFGGFNLDAECTVPELLNIWSALRRDFPQIWLHSPECRLYTPLSFAAEYAA